MENAKQKIFQSVLCFVVCLIKNFFFPFVAEKIKKLLHKLPLAKSWKSFAIDTCLFMKAFNRVDEFSVCRRSFTIVHKTAVYIEAYKNKLGEPSPIKEKFFIPKRWIYFWWKKNLRAKGKEKNFPPVPYLLIRETSCCRPIIDSISCLDFLLRCPHTKYVIKLHNLAAPFSRFDFEMCCRSWRERNE